MSRNYPAKTTKVKDDHIEEIKMFIESRGQFPLSPTHEGIKTRLERMWQARNAVEKTFKNRNQIIAEHAADFGISKPTAENDWNDCITLYRHFSDIEPNTELFITLNRYDELINQAREMGKIEAALQAMSKRAELVAKLQPDPNKPDFNRQVPQVTALIIDPLTKRLFETAQQKMGDPDFYIAFLKLVLDIDDPTKINWSDFMKIEDAEIIND